MPYGTVHQHITKISFYSSTGAPTGQTFAQFPQLMQTSGSITYVVSPSLIALTGHSDAQVPQLTHASVILYAIIFTPKI